MRGLSWGREGGIREREVGQGQVGCREDKGEGRERERTLICSCWSLINALTPVWPLSSGTWSSYLYR